MTVRERLELFLLNNPTQAKKSLGQNFLVSDVPVKKMLQKLEDLKPQNIIEIGPGPGALTDILKALNRPLKLLELDRGFFEYWQSQGLNIDNVDALHWDWKSYINSHQEPVLISNLPYQISSSVVIDRSMDSQPLKGMILMFQKEVAQKIRAQSFSSEFSLLSLISQLFWDIETICDLGPRDFKPAPKVSSRVLAFKPKETGIIDKMMFLKFAKAGFAHKRKFLKKNLLSLGNFDSEKLTNAFIALSLSETARAEELKPLDWLRLYKELGFQ